MVLATVATAFWLTAGRPADGAAFLALLVLGQVIFAVGGSMTVAGGAWYVMWLGRVVFGFGGESLSVALALPLSLGDAVTDGLAPSDRLGVGVGVPVPVPVVVRVGVGVDDALGVAVGVGDAVAVAVGVTLAVGVALLAGLASAPGNTPV
jgi:hypothetical protein